MKKKYLLLFIISLQYISSLGQVGINRSNPTATLDVGGEVLVREKVYLENPGTYQGNGNSKLLMVNPEGDIIRYNITNGSYGPLNYVQMVFKNTSSTGLSGGYDTKISATKYKLAIHGFYFNKVIRGELNTNLTLRKTSGNNRERYIEGHQFYAYIKDGTWWIKGFVQDSQFFIGNNNDEQTVDIYMDVLIYRNDFITKFLSNIRTVDMSGRTTATAELPGGF